MRTCSCLSSIQPLQANQLVSSLSPSSSRIFRGPISHARSLSRSRKRPQIGLYLDYNNGNQKSTFSTHSRFKFERRSSTFDSQKLTNGKQPTQPQSQAPDPDPDPDPEELLEFHPNDPLIDPIFTGFNSRNRNLNHRNPSFNPATAIKSKSKSKSKSSISVDKYRTLTSQWEGGLPYTPSPIPSLFNLFTLSSNSKPNKSHRGQGQGEGDSSGSASEINSSALLALSQNDFNTLQLLHDEELAELGYAIARQGVGDTLGRLLRALEAEEGEREMGQRMEKIKGQEKQKQKQKEDQLNQGENDSGIKPRELKLTCSPRGSERRRTLLKQLWRGVLDSDPDSSASTSTLPSSTTNFRPSSNSNLKLKETQADLRYKKPLLVRVFNLLLEEESWNQSRSNPKNYSSGLFKSRTAREGVGELDSIFGNSLRFGKAEAVLGFLLKMERVWKVVKDASESRQQGECQHLHEEPEVQFTTENEMIYHLIQHLESKYQIYEKRREISQSFDSFNSTTNHEKEEGSEKQDTEEVEIQNLSKDLLKASRRIRFLLFRSQALNLSNELPSNSSKFAKVQGTSTPNLSQTWSIDSERIESQLANLKNLTISTLRRCASSSSSSSPFLSNGSSIETISKESLRQGKEFGTSWLDFEFRKREEWDLETDLNVRKGLKSVAFGLSVMGILNRACLRMLVGGETEEQSREGEKDGEGEEKANKRGTLMSCLKESLKLTELMVEFSQMIKHSLERKSLDQRLEIGEINALSNHQAHVKQHSESDSDFHFDFFQSNPVLKREFLMTLKLILTSSLTQSIDFKSIDQLITSGESKAEKRSRLESIIRMDTATGTLAEHLAYLSRFQPDFLRDLLKGLSATTTPATPSSSQTHAPSRDQVEISKDFQKFLNSLISECLAMQERFKFHLNLDSPTSDWNKVSSRLQNSLLNKGPEQAVKVSESILQLFSNPQRGDSDEVTFPFPIGQSWISNPSKTLQLSSLDIFHPGNVLRMAEHLSQNNDGSGERLKELIWKDLVRRNATGKLVFQPSEHLYSLPRQLKTKLLVALCESNLVAESIALYRAFLLQQISLDPRFASLFAQYQSFEGEELDAKFDMVVDRLGFELDKVEDEEEIKEEERVFMGKKPIDDLDEKFIPEELNVFISNPSLLLEFIQCLKRYQSHPIFPRKVQLKLSSFKKDSSLNLHTMNVTKSSASNFSTLLYRLFLNSTNFSELTHHNLASFTRIAFVLKKNNLAFKALKQLLRRRIIPDGIDLGVLIGGLLDSKKGVNQDLMVDLFLGRSRRDDDEDDYNNKAGPGELENLNETIVKAQDELPPGRNQRLIEPTPYLYNIILSSLFKTSRLDLVDEILRDCDESGMKEELNVKNRGLVLAYSRSKPASLALKILQCFQGLDKAQDLEGPIRALKSALYRDGQDRGNYSTDFSFTFLRKSTFVVEPKLIAWIMRCSALHRTPRHASELSQSYQSKYQPRDRKQESSLVIDEAFESENEDGDASSFSSSSPSSSPKLFSSKNFRKHRDSSIALISSLHLHSLLSSRFNQIYVRESKLLLNQILHKLKDFSRVFFNDFKLVDMVEPFPVDVGYSQGEISRTSENQKLKDFNRKVHDEIRKRWVERVDKMIREIRWSETMVYGSLPGKPKSKQTETNKVESSNVEDSNQEVTDSSLSASNPTSREDEMVGFVHQSSSSNRTHWNATTHSFPASFFQTILAIYAKLGDGEGVQETIAWMMQDGILLPQGASVPPPIQKISRIRETRAVVEEIPLDRRKGRRRIEWAFEVERQSVLKDLESQELSEVAKELVEEEKEEAKAKAKATKRPFNLSPSQRVKRTKSWWNQS